LQISLWGLLGCGCIVLLVAGVQVKNTKTCSDVLIDIDNHGEKIFINEKDIAELLTNNGAAKGAVMENVHLAPIETALEKNAWIRDAQLFFDNNQVLTVKIAERQPVARIFTVDGASFYIDTAGNKLPLSDKFAAKVPVFTSYPSTKKMLTGADSITAIDVKHIAQFIQTDSFWQAQVGQIDITPQHTYEMMPVLGNQIIMLGDADNLDRKFKRLLAFYKQVWSKAGFEKYEAVDVQYEGQVVAVKRGFVAPAADSTTAMQQLTNGVPSLNGVIADSLHTATPVAADTATAKRRPAAVMPRHTVAPAAGPKKAPAHVQPPKRGRAERPHRT